MALRCYHCGTSLERLSLPLGRRDECPGCTRSLHVCLMCAHFDASESTKQCREDDAEEVRDKQSANFCDYFTPSPTAFDGAGVAAERRAERELVALFGGGRDADDEVDEALRDAEDLFRK